MLNRSRALFFWIGLTLLGCSGSDGTGNSNTRQGDSGTGGHPASGGSGSGAAGATHQPVGGGSASGGASPAVGLAGSAGSSGGSSHSAGAASALGTAGTGSAGAGLAGNSSGGSVGNASGGSAGANDRGPAPTFTTIYNTIITPNCGGAQCHIKKPTPFGYDFSSKAAASSSWRADVKAGDAENSPMFQVLNLAIMPKDRPPLTIEQLFMIYDWINAGALDN